MTDVDVQAFVESRIVTRFQPLKVILFGSRAREDARPDSDVDLLVVMTGAPDKRALAVQMRRSMRGLPVPKHIIVTTPDEIALRVDMPSSILRAALREGMVILGQR
ncbi:MAG: nucleotidyltransferase domain-containing protein [Phycisphaerales bacterium]|nr:MAG: nucleotidyltransferase domain-containing protein [Phycisphaerales bacterium]